MSLNSLQVCAQQTRSAFAISSSENIWKSISVGREEIDGILGNLIADELEQEHVGDESFLGCGIRPSKQSGPRTLYTTISKYDCVGSSKPRRRRVQRLSDQLTYNYKILLIHMLASHERRRCLTTCTVCCPMLVAYASARQWFDKVSCRWGC